MLRAELNIRVVHENETVNKIDNVLNTSVEPMPEKEVETPRND
jgi:hypothetical protein